MDKKPSDIQKERIKELELQAAQLLEQCDVVTLASVNEQGYPRICTINKICSEGFSNLWFFTSKRSEINGKATHFENNSKSSVCFSKGGDSVTLIGNIEIVEDMDEKMKFDSLCDRAFFKKGVLEPKCRLLKFHTIEATFWIAHKFRTVKYK